MRTLTQQSAVPTSAPTGLALTLGLAALVAALAAPLQAQAEQSEADFVRDDVLGRMEWRALGPTTFGGRVVDIAVHPTDPSVWYIAGGSGGVFRTVNGGTTFTPIFDDQPVFSIGDIAIAPSNPEVIYVGTGEANNQRSSYWGDGVWKSADGGATWTHTGLRGTDHIGRVIVDPHNADRVWVAALGALYSASDERGLYRTTDGGKSWKRVHHISPDVGHVDVVCDPRDPNTLFAATYERRRRAWNLDESGPGSAIWKSADGGDNWTRCAGGLPDGDIGRIGLDLCASQPDVIYAVIENDNPAPPKQEPVEDPVGDDDGDDGGASGRDGRSPYTTLAPEWNEFQDRQEEEAPGDGARRRRIGGEVYRSDDGGTTWTKHHTRKVAGEPHYYYGQIRVDPNDPMKVYALGVNAWRSEDGGETWKTDLARRLHVDHHALWIDPANSRHMLLGNDGGLAESWDRGKTWRSHDQLPFAQFYAIGVDTRSPYTVYGGTQDNGSWAIPSRSTTNVPVGQDDTIRVGGGDGFYVHVDPQDQNIVYAESQFGALGRLDLSTGQRTSIRPRAEKGSPALRFNWMSPLEISPHNPQTIYFGSQYVHRSHNRGDSWETISPDLTSADPDRLAGDVPHCTVTTISESPHDPNVVVAGTDDGHVWMTRTGGRRWTDLTDRFEGVPPRLWVSRVEVSPSDPDTLYVAFTGYREDVRDPFLFLSTDRGETFRSIVHDLPSHASVNVIREHPRNPDVLFVGHEFGVAVSLNAGGSWHPIGSGMPTQPVHDLLVHPIESDLVVGTHGRGIYVLDISALEVLDADTLNRSFVAFQPRDGHRLDREYPTVRYAGEPQWRADRAKTAPQFSFYLRDDVDDPVSITVRSASGRVLFEHEEIKTAGLHAVEWMNGGGEGNRRRRPSIPAAGAYHVTLRHGNSEFGYAFEVHPSPHERATGVATEEVDVDVDEEAEEGESGHTSGY